MRQGLAVAFLGGGGAAVRSSDIWHDRAAPPGRVLHGRQRPPAGPGHCPEIDCVRHLLPRGVIAAAERRAQAIGLGAERVLICADAITEEAYLTALATSLGTFYEPLDRVPRTACPLDDNELIHAAAAGLLPLRRGHDIVWVIAPRCLTARRLADRTQAPPRWLQSFCLTSSERLQKFVMLHTKRAVGRRAAEGLRLARPLFSSAPRSHGWRTSLAVALIMPAAMLLTLAPAATFGIVSLALCAVFLATAGLRLWSVSIAEDRPKRWPRIDDNRLPIYSIVCALYREAAVVESLVDAIKAFDYPPEKLDVKFVVEPDDDETRAALAGLDLGASFEIITAPLIGPRTKPKALNVALPFVRGSYTVVYDAEDRPEPDQLRRAVDVFMSTRDRVACVQAALTIDNSADNWLARMFTAGYAGQFDVLLPGLSARRMPFPLGGSSNHFRTAVLRKVGGWDPYNVTEDADLGIRLSRLGYRSVALASATYEEAPTRLGQWLRQRTRWYKGWMQTWLVHMRRPRRLVAELGIAGTLSFQLLLAGNVLSALVHPLFMALLGYQLLVQSPRDIIDGMGIAAPIYGATLLFGYVSTIVLDATGLRRRGIPAHAWVLIATPAYWFLLSLAAWRALYQLVGDPQRWEKTEHGLAKTSRISGLRLSRPHQQARNGQSPIAPQPIGPIKLMEAMQSPMLGLSRAARRTRH